MILKIHSTRTLQILKSICVCKTKQKWLRKDIKVNLTPQNNFSELLA